MRSRFGVAFCLDCKNLARETVSSEGNHEKASTGRGGVGVRRGPPACRLVPASARDCLCAHAGLSHGCGVLAGRWILVVMAGGPARGLDKSDLSNRYPFAA